MELKVTQSYQASDIKFLEVYKFAEGKVDIQLQFKTDNPFEPVQISFEMDKVKCREIGRKLLIIADKLDKCEPPKFELKDEDEEHYATCHNCQTKYDETLTDPGYLGLCPKCSAKE